MARWIWADFDRSCKNISEACKCGKKHICEPIWIGRRDWNDDDPMPDMPEESVSRHYENLLHGFIENAAGTCMMSIQDWSS
jgi:hypothetical protein